MAGGVPCCWSIDLEVLKESFCAFLHALGGGGWLVLCVLGFVWVFECLFEFSKEVDPGPKKTIYHCLFETVLSPLAGWAIFHK